MTTKTKTRIAFDFDGARADAIFRLMNIVCPLNWMHTVPLFTKPEHKWLIEFVKCSAIVIDECEFEFDPARANKEVAERIKTMTGKRKMHFALKAMAALFADEPFEKAPFPRGAIYWPNSKTIARADGMKPEDIAYILGADDCDRIMLFPYYALPGGRTAYYELTLGIEKDNMRRLLNQIEEHQRQIEQHRADVFGAELTRLGAERFEIRQTQRTDDSADDGDVPF
jgi:hypothetical protein